MIMKKKLCKNYIKDNKIIYNPSDNNYLNNLKNKLNNILASKI